MAGISAVFKGDLKNYVDHWSIGSNENFDQDSEEWLERLPNQFIKRFDMGVGGYT
jgi:hypothetical protein